MSRSKNKKKPPIILFYSEEELGSQAFEELSSSAIMVLLEVRKRIYVKRKNVKDRRGLHNEILYEVKNSKDGYLRLPHAIMKKRNVGYRMADDTFRKAIKDLMDKGWLDLVKKGGLYHQPNLYSPSYRWRLYGQSNFQPPPSIA